MLKHSCLAGINLTWSLLYNFYIHCWILFGNIFLRIFAYGGSMGKASACHVGELGLIPGSGSSPGEGNGNPLQYSCLENPMDGGAWRLQSMGSPRVRHDWATSLSLFTFMHWRRKWQPTPENPRDSGAWWAAVYGVAHSRTRLKWLSSSSAAANSILQNL